MAEQIAVDSDVVRYHAGSVARIGGDVREAAQAAAGLALGGGAFGVLCSFMVAPAALATAAGVDVITSAGSMLERAAEQLRGWATDAEVVEQEAVDDLQRLYTQVEAS